MINNLEGEFSEIDSKEIVIDEFLGQYIALFSIPLFELENNIINISIIFLLFRFFDITKIGPIKRFENLPNGIGTVSYTHLTLPTKRIV